MKNIILCSASPRRQEILALLGLEFKTKAVEIDEESILKSFENPQIAVLEVASAKNDLAVDLLNQPDSLIITADTIVTLNNRIYGKPRDEVAAFKMLNTLSGNTHQVYTSVCFTKLANGKAVWKSRITEGTAVTLCPISHREISDYVNTGEPMDKAGGYAIQGIGGKFVRRIDGDFYNVMGLPLSRTYRELRDMGIL